MIIIPANTISGGYEVANSLRFNDGSSDYLSRTPSSASNRKTFTFSTWVKRSHIGGVTQSLVYVGNNSNNRTLLNFEGTNDDFLIQNRISGTINTALHTNRKFRDTSAWYHVVLAVDTTQSTASNRVKIYVNGVQETSFQTETYPSQNVDFFINNNQEHNIGRRVDNNSSFFDGYITETVLIDGQALTPTSFGEFDEDTNIWKPIDVSGLTFGNNGFYLDFENSGSLGADVSGNGNNFTVNNLTSVDQSTDTCTNNFATLNPLDVNSDGVHTLSEGNTKAVNTASAFDQTRSTFYLTTGKWFWETKCTRGDGSGHALQVGVVLNNYAGGSGQRRMYQDSGAKYDDGGSAGSYGSTWTTNDIIGVALNLDDGEITFYKNGTTQGVAFTDLLTDIDDTGWTPAFISYNGDMSFNFGSPPYAISSGNSDGNGYGNFEYSVPSGYYALNTKNLAEYG